MTTADAPVDHLTLSGRALALMRRQALAMRGKTGVVKAAHVRASAALPARALTPSALRSEAACAVVAAASTPSVVLLRPTENAARLRRQALSQSGKSALPLPSTAARSLPGRPQPVSLPLPVSSCDCAGRGSAVCGQTQVEQAASASASPAPAQAAAPAPQTRTIRALARARRAAMSSDGKIGQRRVAQATKLVAVLPQQDWQLAIDKGATGRQVAMQRRLVRAVAGASQTTSESTRPSGRVRSKQPAAAVPPKVGQGTTLSGQTVSGSLVDASSKVTGNESGLCRNVTGTEYLGAEPFETICGTRPEAGPAKVGVSSTWREQKITGTEVGRSAAVTGDEVGACRGITGTEYLAREHFEAVCASVPEPAPRKVSVMSSHGGQRVSGSELGLSSKVTGDEAGATRLLTGSQYMHIDGARGVSVSKVAVLQTGAGSTVTGTEMGRSPKLTGDDRGACRSVTGTEYISTQQLQAVCESSTPVAPIAKVGQDQTWRGQSITGSHVGRADKVTGDEYGACAPISGTPYIGRGQYQAFCLPTEQAGQQARLRTEAMIPAAAVTGDRPGAGGSAMTGDARGACGSVSGTPYVGRDNAPTQCPPSSSRYVTRARPPQPRVQMPTPQDFSIQSPARQARERGAVTGSVFSNQRITGPVNKAGGLITGTPEFRHSEAMPAASAAPIELPVAAARRLTGEGSQAGSRVSGDAWQSSGRVTGTEGASSLRRNPSQKGQARGPAMGMNAQQFRDVERSEQPQSRITGSSGNTAKGAAVTLSGGARG